MIPRARILLQIGRVSDIHGSNVQQRMVRCCTKQVIVCLFCSDCLDSVLAFSFVIAPSRRDDAMELFFVARSDTRLDNQVRGGV